MMGAILPIRAFEEQGVPVPNVALTTQASPKERVKRSNGYLFTAAVHGLDYFPDFDRAPFVAAQLRTLYRSLPLELYRRVAESFDLPLGRTETVAEWTLDATLPIPPVGAIALGRSRTVSEIPARILEVRDEFAGYRRTFADFKADLRDARTVRQRGRLARRYQALLAAASGPRPGLITMSEYNTMIERLLGPRGEHRHRRELHRACPADSQVDGQCALDLMENDR
jgi:hypothetical protein